ncbi:MAG: MarR family transcriptional regulator [Candidatus Uhrbacteria bacterium GW2011_GWF2_44_350]|uniref:MarR family transcriptional regulator n=1 Tax=Candidatus Uhrbacteria bacterium GW2011_GWF2_44_350 TaxID=1619000 RepID=A0A0G1JAM0_9BACT|nr:MAG: MarR family transcriptional regulator [Candidatus Uhrbacteria bacterium GW2011_GWF2_44_350]HBR80140.1 MarR family transcriptional regulator [Candidatus Uhrbacteria bacterium]HCU31329.1 MarR family transcriptional regulator [Candidatus Uhrbacteria bacterium]
MDSVSLSLKVFINLSKILTENSRRFNGGLDGLGFNEFVVLFHLNEVSNKKIRRIDLAEKMGLTASGVTRILIPMEKIGLIKKETTAKDARVSYVAITSSGQRNLTETLNNTKLFFEEIFPSKKLKKIPGLSNLLIELGGTIK